MYSRACLFVCGFHVTLLLLKALPCWKSRTKDFTPYWLGWHGSQCPANDHHSFIGRSHFIFTDVIHFIFFFPVTMTCFYFLCSSLELHPISELSQHCSSVCFCGYVWDGSRTHPMVHCCWALLPRTTSCCYGRCRMFQLDGQLPCGHQFPKITG